jgi:hypothetical protein
MTIPVRGFRCSLVILSNKSKQCGKITFSLIISTQAILGSASEMFFCCHRNPHNQLIAGW